MTNIAPDSAISLHIPARGSEEGSGLEKGQRKRFARSTMVWIPLVINQTPGEKDREKKLERNNSTKIDNPIFGLLQKDELIIVNGEGDARGHPQA